MSAAIVPAATVHHIVAIAQGCDAEIAHTVKVLGAHQGIAAAHRTTEAAAAAAPGHGAQLAGQGAAVPVRAGDKKVAIAELSEAANAHLIILTISCEGGDQLAVGSVEQIGRAGVGSEGVVEGIGSDDVSATENQRLLGKVVTCAGVGIHQLGDVVATCGGIGVNHDVLRIEQQAAGLALGRRGIAHAAEQELFLARHLQHTAVATGRTTLGAHRATEAGALLRPDHHLAAVAQVRGISFEGAGGIHCGAAGVGATEAQGLALVAATYAHGPTTAATTGIDPGRRQVHRGGGELDRASFGAGPRAQGCGRSRCEQALARLDADRAAGAAAAGIEQRTSALHHCLAGGDGNAAASTSAALGLDRRTTHHRALGVDRDRPATAATGCKGRVLQEGMAADREAGRLDPSRLQQHVAALGIQQQALVHRQQTAREAEITICLQADRGQAGWIGEGAGRSLKRGATE